MERSFQLSCFYLAIGFTCLSLPGLVNTASEMYVLKTPGDNTHSKMWLTTESSFVSFQFQACTDLKVALSSNPQVTDSNVYEIIVGGWTNTQSVIRRGLFGETMTTVSTPGVLSCDEARPFWVGWNNGNITVGKGNVTGEQSFMYYADPQPYLVVAVSLASGYAGSGNGTYYLYQDEARMATATTPPLLSYDTLWLVNLSKTYVKFGVRTCNDAILALSAKMDVSQNTYEVVIGGYNNTKSDIRPSIQASPSVSVATTGILSCTETRYFWVSFEGGFIEVGHGLNIGQMRFLFWQYDNPHQITAIGFSSWDQENEWEFNHLEDDALLLKTQTDSAVDSNWMDLEGRTYFQFRLKACMAGKIELRSSLDNMTSEPAFKIIIGGQEKSTGRLTGPGVTDGTYDTLEIIYLDASNQPIVKIYEVENLLHCNGFRPFWLSWKDRKVEIGRNSLYSGVIASVEDPVGDRVLRSMHLATADLLHQQEWEYSLNSFLGTAVKTSAPSGDEFKSLWLTLRNRREIYFRVKACSDARVILASYTKIATVSFYEIVLGADGNQFSKIGKDGLTGGNVIQASTPSILHCDQGRNFWASWGGEFVHVGHGTVPGENGFLQLQDSNPYKVRAVAFETNSPTVGLWEFFTLSGQSYVVRTPANEFAGRRFFRLATHRPAFAFDVIACKDAIIVLSNGTHYLAEVVIGAAENTKSEIRSLVGEPVLAEVQTPAILKCESWRPFWIKYAYGEVILGTGNVNEGVILQASIPYLWVETLSLMTRGVHGTWIFNQQSGKYVETETPNEYGYNTTWMTVDDRKSIVFKVKACNDAHVALSNQLGITSHHTYEIVLGAYGNTQSLIRNATQGNAWVVADTPGILNCSHMLTFWIEWDSGLIRVGHGGEVGERLIMHWQDPKPYHVHGLGISSGWGAVASWQFTTIKENTYIAHTSSSYDYTGAKLLLAEKTVLEFRIQACSSAMLALYGEYFSRLIYEVGIGMEGNTVLTVYDAKTGRQERRIHYPDLLSCWQERPFWVSWKGGIIEVGKGTFPHSRILEWVDPAPAPVNTITVFNWPDNFNSEGIWEFSTQQVYQLNVLSRRVGYFDTLTVSSSAKPYFIFSVFACSDVILALSEVLGMTSARSYMVLLAVGADQDMIEIKKDNVRKAHTHINCILHCTQYREFWISWEESVVAVGFGSAVGTNVLLSWKDSHPLPISAVSVSSYSTTTEWLLKPHKSEVYLLTSPHGLTEVHTWLIMQRHEYTFMFDAMTCHELSVIIAGELGVIHNKAYEFLFGAQENTKIEIRKASSGGFQKVQEAPAYAYLHCRNYQPFWVTWKDGVFSAGYGLPYQLPLITYSINSEDMIPVQGVSIGYRAPEPIYWKIPKEQTIQTLISSLKDNYHLRNWMTVRRAAIVLFHVKACHNVVIYLSKNMHARNATEVYLVELGNKGDNYSYIKESVTGSTLAGVHTPGIVDCYYYRPFWISWWRNAIEVGRGGDLGYNIFMRWDSGQAHNIRAAGFSTYGGVPGTFRLPESQLNYNLMLTKPDDGNFSRVSIKMTSRQFIHFRVRACYGARIRLDPAGYMVEIGISDNEEVRILDKDGSVARTVYSPDILSCKHLRLFWVSWTNGVIEMGTDAWLQKVLISWTDSAPSSVTGISLATLEEGEWQTEQHPESELTVKTPDQWDRIHLWISVVGREFITFQVAACHDAHLALSFMPMYPEMHTYQVIIGGWTNTKSAIRDEINYATETKIEVETPGILDCTVKRDFWAGWRNKTITVGTGVIPFQYTFMEWTDVYFFEVDAVGISTGHGATGDWTIKATDQIIEPSPIPTTTGTTSSPTIPPSENSEDNTYTIYTNSTNALDHFVMTTDQQAIAFTIDACRDLYLYLTHLPGVLDFEAYKITLGANDNKQSSIYKSLPNENVYETDTNIFNCGAKTLWVTWKDGKISVGEGKDVTQGELFSWTDSQPYPINSLAFSSKDTKTVKWTFLRESGRILNASTELEYSYSQIWFSTVSQDSAVVRVRTCHDAHILLSDLVNLEMDNLDRSMAMNSYEVALGINNNTQSVMREGPYGTNVVWIDTPGILNCNEFRYFWFRWKDQRLEVGTGSTVGKNFLMEYVKEGHPETIKSIGLSTGWQAAGRWEISNVQGQTYTVYTNPSPDPTFPNWFYAIGKYFTFQVQECQSVEIILAKTPLQTTTPGYSVILGDVSSITRLPDISLTTVDTPNLLHCYSLRTFWITWIDAVRVGKGRVDYNKFMEYMETTPPVVAAVSLQSVDQSTGTQWQVVKSTVGNSVFLTPSSDTVRYKNTWHTMGEQTSIAFKVKACSDARILLATHFGIIDFEVYEVWLGKDGNTVSVITDGIGGILMDEAATHGILRCNSSLWFWIDWSKGLGVGKGQHVGDQEFLNISPGSLPRPLVVTSISLETGPNQAGEWDFSSLPAQYFTVQTPGTSVHNHTWLIPHNSVITFKLRACQEGRILLADNPYDLNKYSREVIIGGWNNTKSAIVKYGHNGTLAEKNTPTILQCQELQDFWIEWSKRYNRIRVGKGEFRTGEFLSHTDADFTHIYAVSVTTGSGYHGEWQFQTSAARVFQFNTTTNYAYDQYYMHISNHNSSTFFVQACNDAHVGLFDYFLAEKAYEIVIGGGGNQKSFIRRTRLQSNQVAVDTPNILNCQQMLPFWVSWTMGNIKVGRGNIFDEQIFMQWTDPDPLSVSFFSTSTGWGSNGLWQYDNIEESAVIVMTPDNAAYANEWLNFKTSQTFVNFAIQGGHSAHLFLAPRSFSAPHYEVIIGDDSNTKSKIIRYVMNQTSGVNEGTVVAEEMSTGILSYSELRSFWLSWQDGKIQLAKHSASGQRFLDWMDTSPRSVHSISLATGPQSGAEWKYSVREVSSFVHVSEDPYDRYGPFLLSLKNKNEATFSVLACKDAYVILSQVPGIYAYRSYEIVIGANENTLTLLKRGENGVLLYEVLTPGILNCQLRKFFWVSWTVNSISFGRGNIPGQSRVLHHNETPGFSLSSLALKTATGVKGTWDFSGISGDVYELHTPDEGASNRYAFNVLTAWTDVIQFIVKACNDAHIALQSVPGSSEDKLFEILLGGYVNTRSEIRSGKGGSTVLTSHEEIGILNCLEYRTFWISWHAGLLEVGKSYPGTHRFMHHQLSGSENVTISAVSTATGWGSQGDWMFYESDLSSVRVTTLPEHNYNQLSKSIMIQNSIVFRVQACRDAHVALSEFFNNVHTATYEIVIGGYGNMNSFIRDKDTSVEKLRVETPNIMDCNNFKAFWVKWETSGRITVGTGAVTGNSIFLDWTDDQKRTFKGLTISTWDGANGYWDFSFLQGDVYTIFTENSYRYNYTWIWPAYNYLTFKVKSCNDAHVLLSSSLADTINAYEIVIGGYSNTKSEIRRGAHGAAITSVDTPNIMNCNDLLPFWVRWQNMTLEVGSGPVDSHVIMRIDDSQMPSIQVAALTSWDTAPGEYQFLQAEATLLRANSSSHQSYWTLHQSTLDGQQFRFKVKTSNDAMLALLSVPSSLNAPSYEITIGGQGNSMSFLKAKSPMGDLIIQASTPNILDPASFRSFWISWYNSTVNFGSGDVVGQGMILSFIDPQPTYRKYVHSVAVASGSGVSGEWEFEGKAQPGEPTTPGTSISAGPTTTATIPPSVIPPTSDDTFMVFTNATLAPDHVVVTTQRKYFVVNVDACHDAYVYLTNIPGVVDNSAYQISIGTMSNTKSSIQKTPPNAQTYEFDTANILPCTSSQPIWVKWDQGEIMVGAGAVVGQDIKFQWKDDQPYSVNAFSLASKDEKPVNWTMLRDYGRIFNASTIKEYSYVQIWITTYYVDSIVLHIKGCRDAHILLSEQFGMGSNTYEAALGILNNTKSVIREGPSGPNVVEVETPGIMTCNEFRYFWFRWKDQRLEVGRGSDVGANKFMEHAKPGHPERILSVGMSTGWEESGRWEVSNVEGVAYSLHTDEITDQNLRKVWYYPTAKFFEFQLRTCQTAHIRLAEIPKRDTTNGYDIVLSNGISSITKLNEAGIQVSKDTPLLLDCTVLRKYWVTWSQGVQVGRGKLNTDLLLELQGGTSVSIAAVSVTTPSPSAGGGEWQVKRDSVKSASFYTPSAHEYKYAWLTTVEETSVLFKVRACYDAYIVLAKFFGITDFGVYEVLIGGQSNTKVEIRHGVSGTLLAEKYLSGPLHCSQAKWFWIDWSKGISVGSGSFPGDSLILSVSTSQMPEQFQIYATAFATGSDGDWEFTTVPAEQFTFNTPSVHGHNMAWMMLQRRYFQFKVRACAEARILLAEDPFQPSTNVKEVVIGGWSNTKSVIYGDITGNQTVAQADTANILNCDGSSEFWISWSATHVSVGKGSVWTQEFLRYNDSNLHHIHALSISTGAGSTGEWEVTAQTAMIYQLHTTTTYDYQRFWYRAGAKTSVQFKVQACKDAHLALFDEYMIDIAYEIVLGGSGNTICAIRRTRLQDNKVTVSTPQIMNCSQMLQFWASWSYGTIKVGKGNIVDDNLFMEWVDPDPLAVSILSISTGWGSTGVWEFSSILGGELQVLTTFDNPMGHFALTKSSQHFFSFSVRACEDAQIAIILFPGSIPVYQVALGSNKNTKSDILRYVGDSLELVAQEDTPGIVDCAESRSFWISWANGEIEVAIGSANGRRFLGWKDDAPQQLYTVSLLSGPGAWWPVEWGYSYQKEQAIVHQTGAVSGNHYGRIILSVVTLTEFVFGVSACHDASVAMSQIAGIYQHLTYELVIGAQNNAETVLRNSTGGPALKTVWTQNILHCNELRYFWLTWADGKISFGKGSVANQGAVFTMVDPQWHPVNSISFLTPNNVTGYWVTSAATDNVYELHTPDDGLNYQYKYNIITTTKHTLQFYVKACNDIHLLLQSVPGSVDDKCFEIVIGGWNNTQSVIRDGPQGNDLSVSPVRDLLNCNVYLPFWVTWRNETVEVGRGYPHTLSFMYHKMTEQTRSPVNGISVTTGWGSQGDWFFYENDVTSVRVTTLPEHNYNQLSKSILNQNTVVFRVQACRDAHLALSKTFNNINTGTYEIIIGGNGNMNSFIRDWDTFEEKLRVDTPNIMDCNSYRPFWAKWETSGRITVGQGAVVGGNTFLDWTDPEKRVFHGITISTWNGASGYWDFSYLQGDVYTIFTESSYRYNYTWFYPTYNYLTFKAKSCNDAHVLLSSAATDTGSTSYEIVIGGFANTWSEIRRGSHGAAITSVETPSIMNCHEFLPFWVRWENVTLEVGSGPIDSHVIMRIDEPQPINVQVASITSWDNPVEYQFLQVEISSIKVNSTSSQSYWTLHQSTMNAQQLKFKVKSPSDAMVSLLSVPSNLEAPQYEITFGLFLNGRTISRLKAKSSAGELAIEADTPGILDANEFRWFWVSWTNGSVKFGSGDIYGQNGILSFTDPLPTYRKDIHTVAVASGGGVSGEWEFIQESGGSTASTEQPPASQSPPPGSVSPPLYNDDGYLVLTDSTKAPDHVVVTTMRGYLVFYTDACKEAYIYLTHVPGVTDSQAYNISIGILSNTKSSVRKMPPDAQYQEFDTANILTCSAQQAMWAKWDQGNVMAGVGDIVGQNVKFQWTDPQPYVINAFSLGSNDDKLVRWTFQRDLVRSFNVSTIKDYSYQQVWLSTYYVDHLLFIVMACRDAHILLSENEAGNNTYEVAFGILDNTKSVIRETKYGQNIVSADTPGIMNCNENRYFWIRWKDMRLEVGTGSVVGQNKIMEHSKPNHPQKIFFAGFSTGWEAPGRWQVSNTEAVSFSVMTNEITNTSDRRVWCYPVAQYFEFKLRTCENAQVRLATIPKQESTDGYDISLSNSVSSIVKLNDPSTQVTKDTPGLLHCTSLRRYWITWSQGFIRLGVGMINANIQLELSDPSSLPISSYAMTTPSPSVGGGEWQFKRETVKSLVFNTPASHQYRNVWYTTTDKTHVSFKVRACTEVFIVLAKFFGITDFGVYEVLIGGQGNTKVEIRHGVGGILLAEAQSSNLLHCSESRWFWVEWANGIYVGTGPFVSVSVLLSVSKSQMPEQFPVCAAAFSTGSSSDGDWELTSVKAEHFIIATPSQYSHIHTWMIMQRTYMILQVRACSEARILLAYDPFNLGSKVKEVVIGGWSNTKSMVYGDLTSNQTVASQDTSGILNCNVFNEFWIQWSVSGISVGKGNNLGAQEFLRYNDSSLHDINALSISTGDGSTGEWQVSEQMALLFHLHTTNQYGYGKFWYRAGAKTYLLFKVQACNDAHVALFDQYLLEQAYEIVIGGSGNTIAAIRRTRLQENKVYASTPQILNCFELREFWVSWSYGIIKAGKGNRIDDNIIMQWQDPDPLGVSVLSISTGWGATGVWEFGNLDEEAVKVTTNSDHLAGHWIEVWETQQYYSFSVRACQNARVFISRLPFEMATYEILLGTSGNTMSEIYRLEDDTMKLVAQESTPGVVDCAYSRSFWISWANGEIEVAIDSANGRRFLGWKDNSSLPLFSLSFGTTQGDTAEWDYLYSPAVAVFHETGGAVGDYYGRIMVSVGGISSNLIFVAACRDASVTLSAWAGIYTDYTLELVIGAQANTETVLRSSIGGQVLKSVQTPQILDCNVARPFWVRWKDEQVSFGTGMVIGQGQIFVVTVQNLYPITSLSFMTPVGVTGIWGQATYMNNLYYLHTPDDGETYKYVYNILTTINDYLIFWVQACHDAHILLQSVPGSTEDQSFEIVIGGWSNTKSVIRDHVQGNELATSSEQNLLHCDSYRQFWVSWENGTISVGKGIPYQQTFLSYQMPSPDSTPINAMTFTSGFGSDADWMFWETDVTSVRVTTLPDHNYNQLSKSTRNQNSVVFRVQACRDAHVALSELFNNIQTNTYEIIIGGNGNMNSFIRDRVTMNEFQRVSTPNIMDCNNYKAFWVKWESETGRITAGQGAIVGKYVFIDWVDPNKRVFRSLTISTYYDAPGLWDFSFLEGNVYSLFTEAEYKYEYSWFHPVTNYVTFKVRTCDNAHLLLSAQMHEVIANAYEIVLGGYTNTKSDIRQGSHGTILMQVDTPNIMNCDLYLPFWAKWENKTLQIGSGALDDHVILKLDDAQMPVIGAVSISSWSSASAEFQFPETQVKLLKGYTKENRGFQTVHRSLLDQTQLVFKVKAVGDARLSLFIVPGNNKTSSYEFEIGIKTNTKSLLRVKSSIGDMLTEVDTPNILNEFELRPFWVSWHNATIRFGTGESVDQNQLISFVDPQPAYRRHVHSVAVATGAGPDGEWEFQGTLDDGNGGTTQAVQSSVTIPASSTPTPVPSTTHSSTTITSTPTSQSPTSTAHHTSHQTTKATTTRSTSTTAPSTTHLVLSTMIQDTGNSGGTDAGMIAGIVLGCIAGLLIILLIVLYVIKRYRKKGQEENQQIHFDNPAYYGNVVEMKPTASTDA